jgi:hypothetical protein
MIDNSSPDISSAACSKRISALGRLCGLGWARPSVYLMMAGIRLCKCGEKLLPSPEVSLPRRSASMLHTLRPG